MKTFSPISCLIVTVAASRHITSQIFNIKSTELLLLCLPTVTGDCPTQHRQVRRQHRLRALVQDAEMAPTTTETVGTIDVVVEDKGKDTFVATRVGSDLRVLNQPCTDSFMTFRTNEIQINGSAPLEKSGTTSDEL